MKIIRNTGTERVIDVIRPGLLENASLDLVTPSFSVFAFAEISRELARSSPTKPEKSP